jgi:hypothetical protein
LELFQIPRVNDHVAFPGKPELWQVVSVAWLYQFEEGAETTVSVLLKPYSIKPLPTSKEQL